MFAIAFASPYLLGRLALAQDEQRFVPFVFDHRGALRARSPVDVSFLLDAPAGKHGFVIARNGHLVTEKDGKRLRLWGVNITDWSKGSVQIPSKRDAALWADTLARFGVNAVRLQFLDLRVPRGLIANGPTTRVFDSAQMDREDYFLAELEKRGIYIDFNLLVDRRFSAADGVRDAGAVRKGSKGTTLYDARLIELQKEYAKKLLNHLNPYTGRRYAQDPAVVFVEINNENAIGMGFEPPSKFYRDELNTLFNGWLADHCTGAEITLLRQSAGVVGAGSIPLMVGKVQPPEAAPLRVDTEAKFYIALERDYFDQMRRYIQQELGSRSLVIATADHNHAASGYPLLLATSGMDVVDGHTYWQHPDSYVHKLPMVNDPYNSTVVELSRSALLGRPYTVSEVNNPFPNDFSGEGIPILAAYGAFQDWDGIFWYTFEPKRDPEWKPYVGDPFDISLDPVKMPELAAGALMFLRGDVTAAREINERSYTEKQVLESSLLPATDRPYFTPTFPVALPLEHEVRIGPLTAKSPSTSVVAQPSNPIRSDTGELAWYTPEQDRGGLVTVDSPKTQILSGFLKSQNRSTSIISAQLENSFCTLMLNAMDARPIASSGKLLLVAGATVRNAGQVWNSAGTDVSQWGGSPTLIEPVRGTITLHGLDKADSVTLQSLDGKGQPAGTPIKAVRSGDDWELTLGQQPTTWYEVVISR